MNEGKEMTKPWHVEGYRRVDEIVSGTRFLDTKREVWTRGPESGSHRGVFKARRERDGFNSCFAGCAYAGDVNG